MESKTSLEEFIFGLLSKAGVKGIHKSDSTHFRCQCPFHWSKKNFNVFSISYHPMESGIYRCFSCGEEGNILTLIMHLNQCTYKEAKKLVSEEK